MKMYVVALSYVYFQVEAVRLGVWLQAERFCDSAIVMEGLFSTSACDSKGF